MTGASGSDSNTMRKAICWGIGILWATLASWFLAPLIAWAVAWIILTGFRGYPQALMLTALLAVPPRWLFLTVALTYFYWVMLHRRQMSVDRFMAYACASVAGTTVLYTAIFVLSAKFLTLFVTEDPVNIISDEVLSPAFSLAALFLMVEWWQPLAKIFVDQKLAISIYTVYFLFKCVYTYWVIWRVSCRFDFADDPDARIVRVLLSGGIVVFAGLVGLPLSVGDELSKGTAMFVVSYEIGWLLVTIPIALVHLALFKWLNGG